MHVPPEARDDYDALIRESAASYVEISATQARARAQKAGANIDRENWGEFVDVGWLALAVPEAQGGSGLGMRELVTLHTELGKGLTPEPLTLCGVLPTRTLVRCKGETAAQLLGKIVDGTVLASVAWQGKPGILSVDDTAVHAVAQDGGVALEGTALFVAAADIADVFIVAARGQEGIGLYRVGRDAAHMQITSSRAADGSTFGTLRFDGVALPNEARIAPAGEGRMALDAALDEARVALCAEMLGAAEILLQNTIDYLRVRKQFGRAIGSFQALQHRAVDLHIQKELSRAAVARAARIFDETTDDANAAAAERAATASACKARLSDAALIIAREAVQLHGAIGYTEEHDVGIYLAHALVRAAMLGNAPAHRRRFGLLTAKLRAA